MSGHNKLRRLIPQPHLIVIEKNIGMLGIFCQRRSILFMNPKYKCCGLMLTPPLIYNFKTINHFDLPVHIRMRRENQRDTLRITFKKGDL